MRTNNSHFSDAIRCNQEEHKAQRYNHILEGINRILSNVIQAKTEEELINTCLSVALEITESKVGFIGEVDVNGLLHVVAVSIEGNLCNNYDKSGKQCPNRDFILNCLYGRIIEDRMSCIINCPLSCTDSINTPHGHGSLTSFLGVPLLMKGKAIKVLAVANREASYNCEQREDLEAIAPAVTQALQRIKEEHERKQAENALHDAYEQIQAQSDELNVQSDELQIKNMELQAQSNQLKKANDTLEAKVKERTAELEEAYNSLKGIEIARKQEIHHRIKNNLQVISSLLDLQAEQFKNKECIKDSEILEAFRESQDRIISMALIHEELYKGGKFETLNFSPYIKELAESLLRTYAVGNTYTSLKLDLVGDAFFDMDTSIPLGIIVNELISNSLKYAFVGREEGEITVKLSGGGTQENIWTALKNAKQKTVTVPLIFCPSQTMV